MHRIELIILKFGWSLFCGNFVERGKSEQDTVKEKKLIMISLKVLASPVLKGS